MLGGGSPLIVFQWLNAPAELKSVVAGIPLVGSAIASAGVPIPVYLDEQVAGLLVDTESTNLTIDTNTETDASGDPLTARQRQLNNTVTITLIGIKDAVALAVLTALSELAATRLASASYLISYFNGSTAIVSALLSGISRNPGSNDNKVTVTITLTKQSPKQSAVPSVETVTNQFPSSFGGGP